METVKEVFQEPKTAQFQFQDLGPAMNHNYLCAVCRENHAVLDMSTGILQPCWSCQKKDYKLVKLGWFTKLFFKEH